MKSLYNGGENAPTRHLVPPTKTSDAMDYILLSHCPRMFCEPLSKHHRLSSRLWATIHHLMVRLYCWRHNLNILSSELSWANSELEFSPLLTSTHGGIRYFTHYQRNKIIISFSQLQISWPKTEICLQDIVV